VGEREAIAVLGELAGTQRAALIRGLRVIRGQVEVVAEVVPQEVLLISPVLVHLAILL
jgi:hypothetical protein